MYYELIPSNSVEYMILHVNGFCLNNNFIRNNDDYIQIRKLLKTSGFGICAEIGFVD